MADRDAHCSSSSSPAAPPVFVGIDVSADRLDVARQDVDAVHGFPNNAEGIARLLALIGPWAPSRVAVEATGKLERPLLVALVDAGLPACHVNPDRVRKFAQALGLLAKTDRLDARVLARFAQQAGPRTLSLPSAKRAELAELLTCRGQLVDARTAHSNQLRRTDGPFARQRLGAVLESLRAEIAALEDRIAELIDGDDDLRRLEDLLRSVAGVGAVLAATLIGQLRELGSLSHRAIAALVGVAPYNSDSGPRRGKRAIRGGRRDVRSVLYVATVAAVRCNPVIRTAYQAHRARGLPAKSAIIACARKLLRILNAMVRDNAAWAPKCPAKTPQPA